MSEGFGSKRPSPKRVPVDQRHPGEQIRSLSGQMTSPIPPS